jgi:hypothetical protein
LEPRKPCIRRRVGLWWAFMARDDRSHER